MWLRHANDDEVAEIAVTTAPAHTVGDLATRLAGHRHLTRGSGSVTLEVARMGVALPPSTPAGAAGLRIGDTVRVVDTSRAAEVATERETCRLVVVAGPLAGTTYGLSPGTRVIGRAPGSDIRLPDPFVGARHVVLDVQWEAVDVSPGGDASVYLEGERVMSRSRLEPGQRLQVGANTLILQSIDAAEAMPGSDGVVPFNRGPRVLATRRGTEIALGPPPDAPRPAQLSLATSLAPVVLALVGLLVFRQMYTLLLLLMTPVMGFASYWESRTSGRRVHRRE